ncbi:hypothetical protein, partial [Enterobacter mori]
HTAAPPGKKKGATLRGGGFFLPRNLPVGGVVRFVIWRPRVFYLVAFANDYNFDKALRNRHQQTLKPKAFNY